MFASITLAVLLTVPRAVAQGVAGVDGGSAKDQVMLTVAVDDRNERRLTDAMLAVSGVDQVAFADDGEQRGDVPGDHIWFAAVSVPKQETISFAVVKDDAELGAFDVVLPAGGSAHFSLRTTPRAIVMDLRAAPPPELPSNEGVTDPLVAHSTPDGASTGSGDADTIRVRLLVDDRALEMLVTPELIIGGVGSVSLRDDGKTDGDTALDGIWVANAHVQRAQYLPFEVADRGTSVGKLTVFLPSSGEAVLRVKTSESAAGLELVNEPLSTGSVDGTDSLLGGGSSGGGRLAHVVWVGIALFALGFAYLRVVIWRIWTDRVEPLIGRVEHLLDAFGVPHSPGSKPAKRLSLPKPSKDGDH